MQNRSDDLDSSVFQLAPRLPDRVVRDLIVMQIDNTVGEDESLLHFVVDIV